MVHLSKPALSVVAGVLLLHLLAAKFDHSLLAVNILLTVVPLLAAWSCFQQARRRGRTVAAKWRLFGLGLAIWAIGQGHYTYAIVLLHQKELGAISSDFWFLLYGVLLMLSVCSADEGKDARAILAADGAQAALAVILIYATLFMSSHDGQHTLPMRQLIWLYFAENLAIALSTTVHLFSMRGGQDRFFHRAVCVYSWFMLVVCTTLIYVDEYVAPTAGKLIEAFWLFPFLCVIALALSSSKKRASRTLEHTQQTWVATMLYNVNPLLFTMCVLLLGADLARHRPWAGFAAVLTALLVYSFRASILLTRLKHTRETLTGTKRSLRQLNSELHEQNLIDPLTRIANRRRFEEVFEVEWNRATRSGWPLTIVMLDIDYFKPLNDRYGHVRGDACLAAVAESLVQSLHRGGELLARYGGEEFVAILPNVDAVAAMATAAAMREEVYQLDIENRGSPFGRLTVSVGVGSTVPRLGLTREALLEAADQALYRAKNNGRNRIETAETPLPATETSPDLRGIEGCREPAASL